LAAPIAPRLLVTL